MLILNLVFVVFLLIISAFILVISLNRFHRLGWEWLIFSIFLMSIWLDFIIMKIMHSLVNLSFVAYLILIAGGCALFIIYFVLETLSKKSGIWLFIRSVGAGALGAGMIILIAKILYASYLHSSIYWSSGRAVSYL